jgi:hypothetical protein
MLNLPVIGDKSLLALMKEGREGIGHLVGVDL